MESNVLYDVVHRIECKKIYGNKKKFGLNMSETVRVLEVLDYINYNSGVSSVVTNYFFHMDRKKVKCDFLLYEMPEEEWIRKIEEQGSTIYASGKPSGIRIKEYEKRIKQFFAQHAAEYDIVHVHIPNAAFTVLRYAKKYGIKTRILHSHNARGAEGLIKKARNYMLNKWGICYANQYYACSEAAGNYLFGEKNKDRVEIMTNAIDMSKFRFCEESRKRIRTSLNVRDDELLLGNVGRFTPQKNQLGLLKIFKDMQERGIHAKLVLLGDGELRSELENRVKEYGIENGVLFTGIVENAQDYLSAMDIFLLPSLFEGLPMVCIEAQAAGLPCIVSKNVTQEIKLTKKLYFADNDSSDEWYNSIRKILKMDPSRETEEAMQQYDIEKQAIVLEEKYKKYGKSTDTAVNI